MKIFNKRTNKIVTDGAETLYKAVSSTLGPKGHNVLIRRYDGSLNVTHDGVTVANAVNPDGDDVYGVELIKQSANRMNDKTGDGTTTVTILTYELIKRLNRLTRFGKSPMVIKRELEELTPLLLDDVSARTLPVNKKKLAQVAEISSADESIGKLVSDVVWSVGASGSVLTEYAQSSKTTKDITTGMRISSGYASPHFISNKKSGEARIDDAPVLVFDGKINVFQDVLPIMGQLAEAGQSKLAIFCEEASNDVLANLVVNLQGGKFTSVVVEVPSHATSSLDDIAARTGAKVISVDGGMSLNRATMDMLGKARSVVSNQESTTIAGGYGDISKYIQTLDKKDDRTRQRIAAMEGRVAIIHVGGINETEIGERKDRIDDAILASQAALRSGIVAGGGSTLFSVSKWLKRTGTQGAIRKALRAPYKKLLRNAAIRYRNIEDGECIDVFTNRKVLAIESGIVDPAEVTRGALETALSVAAISITAGTILDESEE